LEGIDKKLDLLLTQKKEEDQFTQGSVNIRTIQGDTVQAYGLSLLDAFLLKRSLKEVCW